jgi:IclR family acetate operon transcriptional repressor
MCRELLGHSRDAGLPPRSRKQVGKTPHVHLNTRSGNQRVCIEELESERHIKYSQTVGVTAPLHVGAPGEALLAFLPPTELNTLLAKLPLTAITPSTLADPERLRTELSVVQMRGFAIRIGERSPGFMTTPLSLGNAAQHPLAPLAQPTHD